MSGSGDLEPWKKLGELLEQRRITMNPQWRSKTQFVRDRGLEWRLVYDIERGVRDNYRRETLMAVEAAYGWHLGSIASVLAGGEPKEMQILGFSEEDEDLIAGMREFLDRFRASRRERSA